MRKVSVFISRSQHKDSIFRTILEREGCEVFGESLIQFKAIPFTDIPRSDWVFFYSRRGVQYFLDNINPDVLRGRKIACLGSGTEAELRARGWKADFTGAGQPEEVAGSFLKVAAGQRVLFPQARHSRKSIQTFLTGKISVFSLIVYDNVPRSHFVIPDCKVLVFTSPLNVEAYFTKYSFQPHRHYVAIGTITAEALKRKGIPHIHVADKPGEEALALTVLSLL